MRTRSSGMIVATRHPLTPRGLTASRIASLLLALLALGLGPVGAAKAAEPGDNGRIAYTDNMGFIRTINADGTNASGALAVGYGPAWSPDGSRIAYLDLLHGGRSLVVMDADGANKQWLIGGIGYLDQPTWSPDGAMLAYTDTVTSGRDIFSVEIATRHVHRLTFDGTSDGPDWSADWRIAYASRLNARNALLTMDPDGSNKTWAVISTATLKQPDWRASVLAWTSNGGTGGDEIYLDGNQLTDIRPDDQDPVQSPDGGTVAFVSERNGVWQVFIDPAGRNATYVANGTGPIDWQSVQPPPRFARGDIEPRPCCAPMP